MPKIAGINHQDAVRVLGLLPLILFSETMDATIWNALATSAAPVPAGTPAGD